MTRSSWGAVVPVKLLADAKTRLAAYGDAARGELALAFADDVVTALLACRAVVLVVVVTADRRAADRLARPGTLVVPEAGTGLNAAFSRGAALVPPGLGVVALAADLPTLRPDDLEGALGQVDARAFVADAQGVGTTLLAAAPGHALAPGYGPGSRVAHLASGATELTAPPALRRDIDTPEDLREALRIGVGPHTAAVTSALAGLRRPA